MELAFSFLSRSKALLGIQVQMDANMVEGDGLPIIQPVVNITFGFIFMYLRVSFNTGKPHSILDMLGSGNARVLRGKIKDGELKETEELTEEEAIDELRKHHD
jgi:hypothetical protein